MIVTRKRVLWTLLGVGFGLTTAGADGLGGARDPGVRTGTASAGGPLAGLATYEGEYFTVGQEDFEELEGVGDGLGPRFNLDSCAGCHSQPAIGGSAPAVNPQVAVATAFGARNTLPSFITANGPVREARFKFRADGSRDGGVHALFVITGRVDESGDGTSCVIQQDDFAGQLKNGNVVFRIPTPTFGAGLIEQISDTTIVQNLAAFPGPKRNLGISGHVNRNGNDGTVTRFGWKAQNKSLMIFSGEAYNVEMGITNELFQSEREESSTCLKKGHPNDTTNMQGATGAETESGVGKFSMFMRFLAPPTRSTTTPGGSSSISRGKQLFANTGCAYCHSPTLKTSVSSVPALSAKNVDLFSDLAVHRMGPGLADNIQQGNAAGDEFRSAPLWGLGQRVFFLHDGRTSDLAQAIRAHASSGNSQFAASEANRVVSNYNELSEGQKQDLLNFLRSL
ncbi:MAG TPA: di-heme oxidoredictase family protein [Steroidobacteraceae bacterium]|nr:di-heme oxidoredictase family protein [Steroidobacteraceae bacterium]